MHQTLAKMALVAALGAVCPPPVLAAMVQEPIAFDIPSGPLCSSLIEIGRRSGAIVSFSPSLVEGQAAAPVQGRFTPMQAFMRALGASGLTVDVTPDGTVTVFSTPTAKPTTEQPDPAAHAMPPTEHLPQDRPVYALDPVLVLASADASHTTGLRASNASTATRSDTPLSELPQSVSVVTRDALDLQGPNATTTDAMRYVTGVTEDGQGMAPSLKVRGLPAQYLLSGMDSLRRERSIDSAFVERIEVLKGPSGVVGGIAEFGGRGGVVNLVRKSIETQAHAEVKQSFSSRNSGTLRTDLDAAGQLAPGTYWRAVAFGSRTRRTDGGHDPQHAGGLLGVLGYRGADFKATLTLQTDHQRIAPRPASRGGTLDADGGITAIEPGQLGAVDATDGLHWRSTDIELDLSWQLSPQWRMTWKGRQEKLDSDMRHHSYVTSGDGSSASVDLVYRKTDAQSAGMQWGLIGDVETGPMKHKLLVALDLDRARSQIDDEWAAWVVDPLTFQPGVTPLPATPFFALSETLSTSKRKRSVLMQDQVHLGKWIARLAAQRSHSSEFKNPYCLDEPSTTNWDAGLLHQITPTVSVYAGTQYAVETYVQSLDFLPYNGTAAPLRKLRQMQAGTKLELLERRLALTLEAFRLRQVSTMPRPSGLPDYGAFNLPGRSADGVETELSGRVSPALDLHLGMNVIRARDMGPGPYSPAPQSVETTAGGVPKRSMHLLARYRMPGAEPVRNSVGLAFRAYSSSWVVAPLQSADTSGLRLPGGAQFDLSWTRATERWSLRASIENVFNRQLYATQSTQGYIALQPRRSFGVSATFVN